MVLKVNVVLVTQGEVIGCLYALKAHCEAPMKRGEDGAVWGNKDIASGWLHGKGEFRALQLVCVF